jgi:predicted MFS family arabinose efflux permease
MGMKWATTTILRRFGFRTILVTNALVSSAFLAVCAGFTQTTPVALIVLLLFVGGFFRSLQFTSINTMAYADIEADRVSRATALVSVTQQLAVSSGVALGAPVVELTQHFKGGGALQASDFPPAFLAVAAISALSVLIFLRLSPDAGAEMTDRAPAPTGTSDPRVA